MEAQGFHSEQNYGGDSASLSLSFPRLSSTPRRTPLITGGFWSIFAVQTPEAPLLSVEREGADVRVFWPLPATGFVLEQSPTATGAWSQVPFPYATNATDISISTPLPNGNKFYRLRKQ